ncbi:uncharacterized protein SPSK_10928 [Sporothrix schenckii 1099-18]|uniref:Uncharacterized protein n=1 Tax=Sporothrix schenckii 1099-18 TaxID=1397361 RepID=A0A0F2M434_SPOSC|nr:uncharacterized protein SPSK_10928 [Sporothrix schenckii 1099-18]KJR84448.1 hypothetical protein SPSK_10928 [Sporothrix schenckii 1099-18]
MRSEQHDIGQYMSKSAKRDNKHGQDKIVKERVLWCRMENTYALPNVHSSTSLAIPPHTGQKVGAPLFCQVPVFPHWETAPGTLVEPRPPTPNGDFHRISNC